MKYTNNKLITKMKEVKFQYNILDIRYSNGLYVVMLDIPKSVDEIDNIYGVNEDGVIVWRVENPIRAFNISEDTKGYAYYKQSVYVGFLESNDKFLHVVTFFGMKYKLNGENGKLIEIEQSRW